MHEQHHYLDETNFSCLHISKKKEDFQVSYSEEEGKSFESTRWAPWHSFTVSVTNEQPARTCETKLVASNYDAISPVGVCCWQCPVGERQSTEGGALMMARHNGEGTSIIGPGQSKKWSACSDCTCFHHRSSLVPLAAAVVRWR
jgi:hypothetical protein